LPIIKLAIFIVNSFSSERGGSILPTPLGVLAWGLVEVSKSSFHIPHTPSFSAMYVKHLGQQNWYLSDASLPSGCRITLFHSGSGANQVL